VVAVLDLMRERAVPVADADRTEGTDSLEVRRLVSRIRLEQGVVVVRDCADLRRKALV
jgi:hypothetical protein